MAITREQAIIYLVDNGIFTEEECEGEDGGKFYVNGLVNGADMIWIDMLGLILYSSMTLHLIRLWKLIVGCGVAKQS